MTIMDGSLGQRCRQAGVGLADGAIELAPVDPTWMTIAAALVRYLRDELPGARVAHVGSTAVPGCTAKPLLDLSVGLETEQAMDADAVSRLGLVFRSVNPESVVFAIYRDDGPRVANVHVRRRGDRFERWDLLWRDYLRAHARARDDYAAFKHRVVAETEERASYSRLKGEFIGPLHPRVEEWAETSGWVPSAN